MIIHVPSSLSGSTSSSLTTLIWSGVLARDSVSSPTDTCRSDFGDDVEEREASESDALSEDVEEREASESAALREGLEEREASESAALREGLEGSGTSESAALAEGRETRPDRDLIEVVKESEPSESAALGESRVDFPCAESLLDLMIAMRKCDETYFVMQKECSICTTQHGQHRISPFAGTPWSSDAEVACVVW
jgi:hypothetical protein